VDVADEVLEIGVTATEQGAHESLQDRSWLAVRPLGATGCCDDMCIVSQNCLGMHLFLFCRATAYTLCSRLHSPWKRRESVLVMATTIIVFSCLVLASMLGRLASKILHRIVADSFADNPRSQQISWLARHYSTDQQLSDCETGRFTMMLTIAGEISGIAIVAPLWSWCMSYERPAPFDATCVLYVGSLITFVLYVCSFSLYLNAAGEFGPHPKDSCTDMNTRRCMPFVGEVVAVSAGDMASLFEEANWTSTPLLSSQTSRAFSETASQLETMERGEFASDGRKAK